MNPVLEQFLRQDLYLPNLQYAQEHIVILSIAKTDTVPPDAAQGLCAQHQSGMEKAHAVFIELPFQCIVIRNIVGITQKAGNACPRRIKAKQRSQEPQYVGKAACA